MNVSIRTSGSRVYVSSPYHPEFIAGARKLAGKWASPEWSFDGRDLDRIKQLCMDVYGECGEPVACTNVRIDLSECDYSNPFFACGRLIAERKARDYAVKLGDGVVVLEGGFPASGGSVKHPALRAQDGTVIEVRDVPLTLAREYAKEDGYSLVDDIVETTEVRAEAIRSIIALVQEWGITKEEIFPA